MVNLEQIKSWANEAVEMARQTGLTLDYTRGSIGALERELDVLRLNERDDAATWDLACRFGAYLGEVMLRDFNEFGYEWDEDYDGEPILVSSHTVGNANLGKILPITKCNKYLLSGPIESVAKLYAMCLSHLKGGNATDHLVSLGVDPSQVQGMEPAYVRGGRFDANAAAWLLYSDYVFFRPQEISWDGTTHKMLGAQVNAAKMNEIPTLVANTSLLNGLLDLMTELEKDEGLRVPLFMVHHGVQDAIRNEDLTGITLFNLMAQAQALIVKEPEQNRYAVMCDSRLPMGIPAFYQLVARMIWDMRAYNERSGAFEVIFANARNLDADAVLGQVNEMVPGAFSNAIWKIDVMEKPQATLPSEEEARAFEPSESDPEPFITWSFDDEEEEEPAEDYQLERDLNRLVRQFPLVKDIEGTGYLGRVERIEHVRVGDPLVLAADWENEWFDPACIEVFNSAGETLGNLSNVAFSLHGQRELACLLPHVTATVETVTPKSKRRKNAKYALMDVRMELDPAVVGTDGNLVPEAMAQAKALFELSRGERVLLSKGGLVASQLKGAIDVSKARDVANPIGSSFHAKGSGKSNANPPAKPPSTAKTTSKKQEPVTIASGRWTFVENQVAKARRYSIGIPDQYQLAHDEGNRVLAQFVEGIDDESEYPEIICNSMIGDLDAEAREAYRSNMIPEIRIQANRKELYTNDLMNKIGRIVNDWVVEGRNCQVQVFEVRMPSIFPDMFPDTYEYNLKPVVYDHEDFMRITDAHGHLSRGELKEVAFAVASRVELDKPVELQRIAQLDAFCKGPVSPEAFRENLNVVGNLLVRADHNRMIANLYRAVRQADNEMRVLAMGDTMPLIQAEAYNEGLAEQVAYFERYVDVLEKQAELGANGFDTMWTDLGEFADVLIVDHFSMEDDEEAERKVNALGVIAIPGEYEPLRKRYEALKPRADGRPSTTKTEITEARDNDDTAKAVEEVDSEESARKQAIEKAARRADELEREASQGAVSVLSSERDGLLADTLPLPGEFKLAYADKPGEPFAQQTRAERMNATIESTLLERNRVATELHDVRTKIVYAIQAMIDKRAVEEARKAEEEAKQRVEEGARRRAEETAKPPTWEEAQAKVKAKFEAEAEARRKAEEGAHCKVTEEERRRKEQAVRFLSISSLFERMRSLAGDGYCTISRIRTGFEDIVTASQIEESLDRAWRQGIVRKVPAADGSLYAVGWTADAWRKAREGENARLIAERDSRAQEAFEALCNELKEKIEDNEHFFNALRKYTSKFESQISGLKAQLAEARSKLNGIQDSKKQVDAEIKELETELSKAGFFAFRRKGELREALRQNNERKNALSKEEKTGEERITSLYEKLDALSRMTAPADKQIEETKSALSDQRRELERKKLELQKDVKESIRAMMSLYACPVDARWCVENVSGVNDESTARNALNKLVQTNDAIKLGTIDAYALTASGAHKRKPEEHGQDASDNVIARVASEGRKDRERRVRELYRMLPYVPDGHTVRGIVGMGYPGASNSQKVAALLHVAVGMGLFQMIEDNTGGKKVVYYRRQVRR